MMRQLKKIFWYVSKNHRVYSLGHDPSILGLIWGIKDIVSGTFSYIDKNGVLHIDKVIEPDLKRYFMHLSYG